MNKKTSKIKRVAIIAMVAVCALSSATAINASAKTLKESFTAVSSITCIGTTPLGTCKWAKQSTAKTTGYYKYHYVRAYVGGSSNSTVGAVDDSGRKYSYGDVTAFAQGGCYTGDSITARFCLPTAYAKYGS